MAITDLTGTKWQMNARVSIPASIALDKAALTASISTTTIAGSTPVVYDSTSLSASGATGELMFNDELLVECVWFFDFNEHWQTRDGDIIPPIVEITGGDYATNAALIAFFEANATQVVDPPTDWLYKFLSDVGLLRVFQKLKTVFDKKSALDVSTISTAGGGDEVHATISQEEDAVNINYYKNGSTPPDYVNLNVNEDGFRLPTAGYVDKQLSAVPFIATYEQTTYADVTAAIDADRAIVVNFANNRNLICVTYATYTVGQNVTMSGIYKYGSGVSLAEITLTHENAWSIAHTWMQERLESGTNIKTVNNQSLLGSGNLDVTVNAISANEIYSIVAQGVE